MYSVVLFMSMSTAPAAPAFDTLGVLFTRPRAGCAGATATREKFVASAPVRGFVARVGERVKDRPRGFVERVGRAPRAAGCVGATFAAPPAIRATGCTGAILMPPAAPTAAVPAEVGRPHLFQRLAVHRTLRQALGRAYDSGTPEQKAIAAKTLSDPDLYEAAVTKVHRDLNKKMQATPQPVGAIGDGTLLKLLLDNLPAIINAIKQILELLGLAVPSGGYLPMPVGPYPCPRVVAPGPAAWSAC